MAERTTRSHGFGVEPNRTEPVAQIFPTETTKVLGAIIVAVKDDEDRSAIRLEPREPHGLAECVLSHQFGPVSPDGPADPDMMDFAFLLKPAKQYGDRFHLTVAFDDGLDSHFRASKRLGTKSARGWKRSSAGCKAFERNSSPAPIRCC